MLLKFNNFTLDKECKITYSFNGFQTLEFKTQDNEYIECEASFLANKNKYIVKSTDNNVVSCELDLTDFRQTFYKGFKKFESMNLTELLSKITSWTVLNSQTKTFRRTLEVEDESALSALLKIAKLYDCTFEFDALNRILKVVDEPRPIDLLVSKDINLISLAVRTDTYEHYTRLYGYGAEGITFSEINNGKDYVENLTYSNKVIPAIFRDDRFTNKTHLKEHCLELLERHSKPVTEYTVKVVDIQDSDRAKLIQLHDEFTLLNHKTKQKEKHRVIELVRYSEKPWLNEITVVNKSKLFSEFVQSFEEKISSEITKEVNSNFKGRFEKEIHKLNERFESLLVTGHKIETEEAIFFVDRLPKESATNVLKIGVGGIMGSSHGWNGPFEMAISNDGRLNLNKATIGELDGQYLKVGTVDFEKLSLETKNRLRDGLATRDDIARIEINNERIKQSITSEVTKQTGEPLARVIENLNTVRDSVRNIKVGGVNLLLGTRDFKGFKTNGVVLEESEKYKGLTVVKHKEKSFKYQYVPVEAGETYTFSFYARGEGQVYAWSALSDKLYRRTPTHKVFTLSSAWKRYSYTFEAQEDGEAACYIYTPTAREDFIYTCGWKLENGTIATPWSPALEDDQAILNSIPSLISTEITNRRDELKGVGIDRLEEFYLVSPNSSGVTISTSGWSVSLPTMTATNKYLWTYEKTHLTDGTIKSTTPVIIGTFGRDGRDGRDGTDGTRITRVTNYYKATSQSSGVRETDSGWTTTTQPLTPTNKHLWNYEHIEYSDNTFYKTTPHVVGVYGDKGEAGRDGVSVTRIEEFYLRSASNTGVTTSTSGWSSSISTPTETLKYLWKYERTHLSNGSTKETKPVIISTFVKDGKGILRIENFYLLNNLSTGVTTSSSGWSTSVKSTTSTNRYLWNYEKIYYTDGTHTTTLPVVIGTHGLQGATGPAGATGAKGETGATGAKGDKGDRGEKGEDYEGSNLLPYPKFDKPSSTLYGSTHYITATNNSSIITGNNGFSVANSRESFRVSLALKTKSGSYTTVDYNNSHIVMNFRAKASTTVNISTYMDNNSSVKENISVVNYWKWHSAVLSTGQNGVGSLINIVTDKACTLEIDSIVVQNLGAMHKILESEKKIKVFESNIDKFTSEIGTVSTILSMNLDNLCTETDSTKTGNDLYFHLKEPKVKGSKYTVFADLSNVPDGKQTGVAGSEEYANGKITIKNGLNTWVFTSIVSSNNVNLHPLGANTTVKNVRVYKGDLSESSFATKEETAEIKSLIDQQKDRITLSVSEVEKIKTTINPGENLYVSQRGDNDKFFKTKVSVEDNTYYTLVADLTGVSTEGNPTVRLYGIRPESKKQTIFNGRNVFLVSYSSTKTEINIDLIPTNVNFTNVKIYKGDHRLTFDKEHIVTTRNVGTEIRQNAESVRIAWNQIAQNFQFEVSGGNATLSIYNGVKSSNNLRVQFDEDGNHFYRDGKYLGRIGTNTLTDKTKKGLTFNLEHDSTYMSWSAKSNSNDTGYHWKWVYINKYVEGYTTNALSADCDIDLRGNYLRRAKLSDNCSVPVNAIEGGVNFTTSFVTAINGLDDGRIQWYTNKMVFKNGILIG